MRRVRGLRVGQVLALSIGLPLVLAAIGIGLALSANARLTDRRELLVDDIAPAQLAAEQLENALVDEETGVRGYLLTHQSRFLEPYHRGLRDEAASYGRLARLGESGATAHAADVAAVRRQSQAWRVAFVEPVLHQNAGSRPLATDTLLSAGKVRFDAVRRSMSALQHALAVTRSHGRHELFGVARVLEITLVAAGALIVLGLLAAALLLRRLVTRPLRRLGREARRVAEGDFQTPLEAAGGARELEEVSADVDAMRERIVEELGAVRDAGARLEHQAVELRRSNVELEQFAYVASHDLQEPLRKIASFCQALQRRYQGQLDERADQYIEFAVDGAKRMQILINDLLAFSRVGRGSRGNERLDVGELVAAACSSLSGAIEEAGASVVTGDLPVVRGDRALLVSVFQNLIANAVKFRGPEAPVVRIDARRAGDRWELACTDNGIGIEREYAERIFVIFQRLHPKERYPGTGIGLAMCRKIVEHHGGRIWLDSEYVDGTCIRFTLPIEEDDQP
jgi:signal transduction histidine kinase